MANLHIHDLRNENSTRIQLLAGTEIDQVTGGERETTVLFQQFDDGSSLVTSTTVFDGWRGSHSTWSYDIDGKKGPVYTTEFFLT